MNYFNTSYRYNHHTHLDYNFFRYANESNFFGINIKTREIVIQNNKSKGGKPVGKPDSPGIGINELYPKLLKAMDSYTKPPIRAIPNFL